MTTNGWAWPAAARKAHYFKYGRSLCGGWGFVGEPSRDQETPEVRRPNDCKRCWEMRRNPDRETEAAAMKGRVSISCNGVEVWQSVEVPLPVAAGAFFSVKPDADYLQRIRYALNMGTDLVVTLVTTKEAGT